MILRSMALETGGASTFDYDLFKQRLKEEMLTDRQSGPLKLRLDILESFMTKDSKVTQGSHLLNGQPGRLTIVDLTDPTIDTNTVCVLFDIALAIFLEQTTKCGKIVGLDEAHNVRF